MQEPATIFALSSAPGRAGVSVVRISGPRAGEAVDALVSSRPQPRFASLRTIRDPESGEVLDQALVIWFAAPRTETGEDMAELHLHGGPSILRAVLAALARRPGCRLAEPGEFARRAFENGKIDLAEAEGLADLIEAETEAQRRQAMRQVTGELSALYESWRTELIAASALVESAIDFSDEPDVAADAFQRARAQIAALTPAIRAHLDDGHRGEILREGLRVVLAGPPNVGKSSLLNALARRDAAIVSSEAGTTRDVIEVRLDLEGMLIIVSDTAGIREASAPVEMEGIRRSLAHARDADIVVWLSDASSEGAAGVPPELAARGEAIIFAANKTDLPAASPVPSEALAISAKTGSGIDLLASRLAQSARERVGTSASPAITRERYRHHLQECADAIEAFLAGAPQDLELRAEDLRTALHALGRITGRVDVESVLGEIFGRFCIGK
jgi:tRNA modification GTPase